MYQKRSPVDDESTGALSLLDLSGSRLHSCHDSRIRERQVVAHFFCRRRGASGDSLVNPLAEEVVVFTTIFAELPDLVVGALLVSVRDTELVERRLGNVASVKKLDA